MNYNSNSTSGVNAMFNAEAIENQQWVKYHTKAGQGFAAEDANAINDLLHGKVVDKVGLSNELNGADRIVDGINIQTKYYQTAQESVAAAFDKGQFRYQGMKLEVPRDQYEEAVRLMADRIRAGQVPGVTDPSKARDIVMPGSVTYREAVNIAKAGNIDSIKFDVKTQVVSCVCALGLSFVVSYTIHRCKGCDIESALKASVNQAVKTGFITMAAGVAVQQLLRTAIGRSAAAVITKSMHNVVGNVCKTQIGRTTVQRLMSSIMGKQVTEAAAKTALIKMARTNVITTAAVTVATTIPDMVKAVRGRISWSQFGKNTAVNVVGIGTGSAGAWGGAAIGTLIFPGIGTVIGGLLGGIGGGIAGSAGSKKLLDNVVDDDSVMLVKRVEDVMVNLCNEHYVDEDDFKLILEKMKRSNVFKQSLFEKAYAAGGSSHSTNLIDNFFAKEFRPYFA